MHNNENVTDANSMKINDTWLKYAKITFNVEPFTRFWISVSSGSLNNPAVNAVINKTMVNGIGFKLQANIKINKIVKTNPIKGILHSSGCLLFMYPAATQPIVIPTAANDSIKPVSKEFK